MGNVNTCSDADMYGGAEKARRLPNAWGSRWARLQRSDAVLTNNEHARAATR